MRKANMAQYFLTESSEVDWAAFDWLNVPLYDCRHENQHGQPFVQEEMDRRRVRGESVVLWRLDGKDEVPVMIDEHSA
jgi:hypothetical protein